MATGTPAVESSEANEGILALKGLNGDEEGKEAKEDPKVKGEGEKTEEEKAAEDAEAERLKPQEIEENGMKRVETSEEVAARIKTEDAVAAEPTEAEKQAEEMKDLRQIIRTSKRDQAQLRAKVERLEKRPVKVVKEEEEEEEGEEGEAGKGKKKEEEESLSRLEELQTSILQVSKERGASLDILLETMEQGAYKDIRGVCSRGNFDDIFESIATEASKETGKNIDEALLEVELGVWSKENPYKYMYDLIKKYHPTYAKKEETAKPGEGERDKKTPVVVKAPGSIADKGGDSVIKAGWNAKRIDDMDEDELSTVPEDVYDTYLKGELK